MSYNILLVFLSIVLVITKSEDGFNSTGKLRMVHVIFRHGDRYPLSPCQDEPVTVMKGELTEEGQGRAYQLGIFLRQHYADLVGDEFDPDVMFVRSTNTDRTLMSAQCAMAGLIPRYNITPGMPPIQAVPVHTQALNTDWLYGSCPAVLNSVINLDSLPQIIELKNTYKQLLEDITECTGTNVTNNMTAATYLFDCFTSTFPKGYKLPTCVAQFYPEPMTAMIAKVWTVTYNDTTTKTTWAAPILDTILTIMLNSSNDTRRFFGYSAHDDTLTVVLAAMNTYNGMLVPYSSAVIFELIEMPDDFYVQVLYQNQTSVTNNNFSPPYVMNPFNCGEMCSLSKFQELSDPIALNNEWKTSCSNWTAAVLN